MKFKNLIKSIKTNLRKYKVRPTSVTIDISNRCNALCPFCTRQISQLKRNEIMPKDMFYEIMDEISKIKTVKQICFAAFGEPLLHPDFDEFTEYVVSKGYRLSFPTNMQLADKHFDSLLKASNIMFSIEGDDKESYEASRVNLNFEKTLNNIKEFDRLIREKRQKGEKTPNREINCLITKDSMLNKYMELWAEYTDILRIGPVLPSIIWDNDNKSVTLKYNDQLKHTEFSLNNFVDKMYCNQIFNSIIIRANGKLALCCSDFDFDVDFGTYKDLKNTYFNNENLQKIRKEFKQNKLRFCKNCYQNFEVKKETLLEEKPELEKITKNPKVILYTNR